MLFKWRAWGALWRPLPSWNPPRSSSPTVWTSSSPELLHQEHTIPSLRTSATRCCCSRSSPWLLPFWWHGPCLRKRSSERNGDEWILHLLQGTKLVCTMMIAAHFFFRVDTREYLVLPLLLATKAPQILQVSKYWCQYPTTEIEVYVSNWTRETSCLRFLLAFAELVSTYLGSL